MTVQTAKLTLRKYIFSIHILHLATGRLDVPVQITALEHALLYSTPIVGCPSISVVPVPELFARLGTVIFQL